MKKKKFLWRVRQDDEDDETFGEGEDEDDSEDYEDMVSADALHQTVVDLQFVVGSEMSQWER